MKETTKSTGKHDWSALDVMIEEERHAAALSDPDAQPIQEVKAVNVRRRPLSWQVRRGLGLSQTEFSERYGIPIGTVRDWDQGRNQPDAAARALLNTIAAYPEEVARAQELAT